MNLKPSPLTEASAALAIAILGILLTFSVSSGSVATGFAMVSNSALIFLLPTFTFWAVIGLFIRAKSNVFRMLVNIAITAVVTGLFSSLVISSVAESSVGTALERELAQQTIAGMALVTFFSCALGAVVTYLWLLRSTKEK